jgi:hypothetical protein
MPEIRMKSLAINCGVENDPRFNPRVTLFGPFQNVLNVDFHHMLAQIPINQEVIIAVQHAAQIVERPGRDFCSRGSEREFTLEERWYADEEIQAGADRDAAAAGWGGNRQRKDHPASLQRSADHRPDLLPLAEGIRRVEAGPAEAAEGSGTGERQAEAVGGGVGAGEAYSKGRCRGKLVSPLIFRS